MNSEIIALQCPSCGSSDTADSRAVHFGREFTCKRCKTTSVLVINSKLHIRSFGEHVCMACGRVASAKARFCQCGSSLVQKCRWCTGEFPVDHALCDSCGRSVAINPESAEGQELKEKELIQLLSSNDRDAVSSASFLLSTMAVSSTGTEAIVNILKEGTFSNSSKFKHDPYPIMGILPKLGSRGISILAELAKSEQYKIAFSAISLLGKDCGEAAAPSLLEAITHQIRVQPHPERVWFDYLGRCGAAGVPILIEFLSSEKWPGYGDEVGRALIGIGRPALSSLKKLTGFFADSTIKNRALDIISKMK